MWRFSFSSIDKGAYDAVFFSRINIIPLFQFDDDRTALLLGVVTSEYEVYSL